MSNGSVALALLPQVPSPTTKDDVKHQIGEATAQAVWAICRAGGELRQDGLISYATNRAGAEKIYHLYELNQSMPGIDFAGIAHREGLNMVRGRCLEIDPDLDQHHSMAEGERVIAKIITEILTAVDEVAAFEQSRAN